MAVIHSERRFVVAKALDLQEDRVVHDYRHESDGFARDRPTPLQEAGFTTTEGLD